MKDILLDTFGRVHSSLRLSVTDRCNFRCPYCMPLRDLHFQPREGILTYEELERLVRVGMELGVREVRITGGEPLLRRDLYHLIRKLATLTEIRDLSLTTNGYYLKELCHDLKQAGLRRVNVSIDTLRSDRFRKLAHVDGLPQVLEGIKVAQRAGFSPLKVNTVLMRGINDDEIIDLVDWARSWGVTLRFIELMPIGGGPVRGPVHLVPGEEVKERIHAEYPLVPMCDGDGSATARTYRFADGSGDVGFINPVTEPFCERCDRVRITADGKIRNCLFDEGELDLRGPLRAGASVGELRAIWQASVRQKGPGGCLNLAAIEKTNPDRRMWQIGG